MNFKTSAFIALALVTASAFATELPKAEAEVRRVDTAGNKISLKHGEIKNLDMPPMSMVFQVSDPALLTKVKAGDKVRFTADKVNGAYTVLNFEVGCPAPPQTIELGYRLFADIDAIIWTLTSKA